MSASIDVHTKKKVLMIAANPGVSPTTGWPVGFWWPNSLTPTGHSQRPDTRSRLSVRRAETSSPTGFSDPEDASGYSAHDLISLGFKKSEKHAALLKDTKSITDVDPAAYDAIFLAGGQSPMVTMIDDTALHTFVARAYEAGKIVSIVCHGTCILLKTRLSNGDLLVNGKTWTGFANSEEAYADAWVGKRIQPFWIEEEARKLEGTNFIVNSMFKAFAVRDGNLITGQQQFSGGAAAEMVVETLGR